ncbi:MAG: UDP-N-acetylmuramate dehydrogenase [Deltaproteobacteria bacterium]|nr:UDP-N-acetylmuramate dehydrogenase [Deltaproteobacteria bacterium]
MGDAGGGSEGAAGGATTPRSRVLAAVPPPARRMPTAPMPPSPALLAALAAAGAAPRLGEPLGRHTSFRIGGPADVFVEVASVPELAGVLAACAAHAAPVFFLGGGTNLLVSDRGARGVVVKLGRPFDFVEWQLAGDAPRLRAGAAVPFKRLAMQTVAEGLAGLEFGEGIPGTIGGGLLMNAGAFGGEIGRAVDAIEVVTERGDAVVLSREQLGFAYRRLELPMRAIVTAVRLRLARGEPAALAARILEAKARRDRLQPKGHPNAGSIFKNPPGAPAGKLLEAVGLKGARLGNAMVSLRHANFIVNLGGARAADVKGLMDLATRVVRQRLGVELEPEVRLVGDW